MSESNDTVSLFYRTELWTPGWGATRLRRWSHGQGSPSLSNPQAHGQGESVWAVARAAGLCLCVGGRTMQPGMPRPWGRGQRGLSTWWGGRWEKIASSGQALLLLTEQHPGLAPAQAKALPGSGPPSPSRGAGCWGSAGFHPSL